jgi:phosphomevalonate kinase
VEVTASAPGKVFVAGEYGVLIGGPAVIAAVGRRLRCRVRLEPGAGRRRIRSVDRAFDGTFDGTPASLPLEIRFVAAAAAVAARFLALGSRDLTIETESELDPAGAKRGLGGSAAVTAATLAAIFRAAGRKVDETDLTVRVALGVEAHRLAQGSGSAADVVTATVGGLVLVHELDVSRFPRTLGDCDGTTRVRFERIALPRSLGLEVVATGRPAASGPRARRFLARARGEGTGAGTAATATLASWCEGMRAAVEGLAASCRAEDAAGALAATASAGRLVEQLGGVAGLPILTRELRLATRIARECGAVAKSSGAGGGDCAIALVATPRREALRGAWSQAGLEPLAVEIDANGARIETSTERFADPAVASPVTVLRGGSA